MENKVRKYTWKPDVPDSRDHLFSVYMSGSTLKADPIKAGGVVDFRSRFSTVYDQGNLGSCTSNAIAMAIDFERIKQQMLAESPSRLFIYYNERVLEGTVNCDCGASLRDGMKTVNNTGAARESLWPYRINSFKTKPPLNSYNDANNYKIKQYLRLDNTNLAQLKSALDNGYGFVFGFLVYQSFETAQVAKTGNIPMPKQGEQLLGGHACYCLGYNDKNRTFIVRNSWGSSWGDGGHFYIPYDYLTNLTLAGDFWSIQLL